MKAKTLFVSAALLLSLCFTGQARASLALQLGDNVLSFSGFETGIPTTFDTKPLAIGSVFVGALNVSSIYHVDTDTSDIAGSGGNGYITALFVAQVRGQSLNSDGKAVYTLGAYKEGAYSSVDALMPTSLTSLFSGIDNATVMKLYQTDSLSPLSAGNTETQFNTIVSSLLNNGTLWATIGYGSGDSMNTTITTPDNALTHDQQFADFKFDLTTTSYVGNTAGFIAGDVNGSLGLSRTITSVNNPGAFWQINASQTADISAATPEPATVIFMGAGILGLFGLRRKSR